MADYRIIYWMHIPTMVIARGPDGKEFRFPLPPRFQNAVDAYAMAVGIKNDDDYLAGWRKGEWQQRDGSPQEVGPAVAAELDIEYASIPIPRSADHS
jgi:hypothetical protein